MFNDDGVRSHNQIQGVDSDGNLKNIKVNENGEILVSGADSTATVAITKTLACDNIEVGTEKNSITINAKVSQIKIANYSETAIISVAIPNRTYNIGPNIVVELSIGDNVTTMDITSNEDNTMIQYVIEGEE